MIDVIVEIDRSKASFFVAKDFLASQEIVEVRKNGNIIVHFKVLEPISLDEKIKNDLRKYLE